MSRCPAPDGLLKALTKTVIETALDEEVSEHLGYDKHAPEGLSAPSCIIIAASAGSAIPPAVNSTTGSLPAEATSLTRS